jgi:hypothetical protein
MSDLDKGRLVELLRARVAKPHEFTTLKNWPHKQMAIGSHNKFHAYSLGVKDEHMRLEPYLDALIECAEAMDTYLEADTDDYHTSSTVDMNEALSKLRTLLEAP